MVVAPEVAHEQYGDDVGVWNAVAECDLCPFMVHLHVVGVLLDELLGHLGQLGRAWFRERVSEMKLTSLDFVQEHAAQGLISPGPFGGMEVAVLLVAAGMAAKSAHHLLQVVGGLEA
jgi:hypothetical protein